MPEPISVSIAQEARKRFLTYAMSVVQGRALPDVRDGLKPVQRRILFGMYQDLNLTFDRKAAKSAQIVGKVMGDYHPHGDVALYDAMVRMAQEWVLRVPLVHGQGNFGSVDGDPPAANRYTEAKLSRAAEYLLTELDQETVDMRDNYTGTKKEPVVLPAQFPNLLVNGTSGIAVGMATNLPPHNLGEVLRSCIYLIDNPDATVAVLMDRGVKGPDFPLGGKIVADRATIRKIYETGEGSIKVQGEWKEEKLEKGKTQIVVTSIPYGVNKGELEKAIGEFIEDKKLPQALGISNESNDKDGMRIAIELRPGAEAELVMAYLYKHTELQRTFSYNTTCLVPTADGKTMVPRDGLSLKDLLQHFLDFRLATVRRRFEYHLRQLRRRIHILEGFAIIFDALDKAIRIIRNSEGKADAATKLMAAFDLDEEQTNAILESQLYKIAQMEINKILEELKEKKKEAARIQEILNSKKKLWGIIKDEMNALIDAVGERRKTRMASDEDVLEFDEEAYIVRENTNVVLTKDGWIKRVGRLASVESTRTREGDEVVAVAPGNTLDHVVFFGDDGAAYTMRMNEVPASSGYGEPITKFFRLADQVKVIAAISTDSRFTPADKPAKDAPPSPYVLVATKHGYVLRVSLSSYRDESTKVGRKYVKLEEGDKVVFVTLVGEAESMMLASRDGRVIHFAIDEVNILAGVGKGVIGLKLDEGDEVIGGGLIGTSRFDKLVVEASNGKPYECGPGAYGKVHRGGKGQDVVKRLSLVKVIPPSIELADWDAIEGKAKPKEKDPGTNGTLFDA